MSQAICSLCGKQHDGYRKELHIDDKIFVSTSDLCCECFIKIAANKTERGKI